MLVKDLQLALSSANEEQVSLKNQHLKDQQTIAEMQKALLEANCRSQTLKEQLDVTSQDLTASRAEVSHLQHQNQSLQDENVGLNDKVSKMGNEFSDFVQNIEQSLQDERFRHQRLQLQLEESEGKFQELIAELKYQAIKKHEEYQQSLQKKDQVNQELESRNKHLEKEMEQQKMSKEKLQQQLKQNTEAQMRSRDQALSRHKQLMETERTIHELKYKNRKLIEAQQTIHNLKSNNIKLLEEMTALKAAHDKALEESTDVRVEEIQGFSWADTMEMKDDLQVAVEKIAELMADLESVQNQRNDFLKQLRDAEKTIIEQEMTIEELQKEFKNKDDSRYKRQHHQRSKSPQNRAGKLHSWSNHRGNWK